jgi:hypothetical protein
VKQSVPAVIQGEQRLVRYAQLMEAAHKGEPLRLKAARGDRFVLEDNDSSYRPEAIQGKRVASDLHVSLPAAEGQPLQRPQLIIENFYAEEAQLLAGGDERRLQLLESAPFLPDAAPEPAAAWRSHAGPQWLGSTHQLRQSLPAVEAPATQPPPVEVLPPPTQQARLLAMGRDSGHGTLDFLTNDGGAGRLLHGHLDSPLQAGEQVQVSTDGGLTWYTARLTASDRWVAVDARQHAADFAVQSRVLNAQGLSGPVHLRQVTLDTQAPAPPDHVSRHGDQVEVSFAGSGAGVGDVISLIIGDYRVEHVLSAEDIARGQAVITLAPALAQQAYVLGAALLDAAGNVSAYRASAGEYVENWSSHPLAGNLGHIETAGMSIALVAGTMGLGLHQNWPVPMPGLLFIGDQLDADNRDEVTFGLRHGATRVALSVHYAEQGASYLVFHDAHGAELGRLSFDVRDGSTTRYEFTAPPGTQIASFTYLANGETAGLALSDFDIRFTPPDFSVATQRVVAGTGHYLGDASDNAFLVSDVALLGADGGRVDGNGGTDTLRLQGSGQTLDLTALGASVRSIEIIDLAGTGPNALRLSLEDVLSHGEVDLFRDADGERVQMMVKGTFGDSVELQGLSDGLDPGAWSSQGPVTLGGVLYQVFQHSALQAELLVQDGVTVNLL